MYWIEHVQIPMKELRQIENLRVVRAQIYLYRLAPRFLNFLNHYGVLLELENGKRYMIHNSPNNLIREGPNPEHGHEIVIEEAAIA